MIRLSNGERLVELERSGVVESVHTGHLAVLDAGGTVTHRVGNPEQVIFPRSSLKPIQAAGMLRVGLKLDLPELAMAASSHSGSMQQRDLVAAMLAAAGLAEEDLDCPPDLPLGTAERRAYLAAGLSESRLAMNCSGKHAAMLLTCLANGWPASGYLAAAHPLQRALAATVADFAGEPIATTGVDGCGAPLFAISLVGLARSFHRLVTGSGPEHQVAEAFRAYPELVGGPDRQVTTLMRTIPGLVAKDGAEGVFAASLPDGGTVAVKIDDGAARAADSAVAWSLHHLGVDPAILTGLANVALLGGGEPVGWIRPVSD